MAKNSSGTNRNINLGGDYDQMQANIRKAKGNPNKNVHQKKNGSNYKGYAAARKAAETEKISRKAEQEKQPLWVTIAMVIIFIVLVVVLVLMNGVLKDNLVFSQVASLVIGLSCGILFYVRRFSKHPDSTFQKVLSGVLCVMAVVYTFVGAYGLFRLL